MMRMRKMARVLLLVGVACMVGCGSKEQAPADAGKPKVIASFYPMYIMARNVMKDVPGVSLASLAPSAAGCLHDYAITTDDMKRLSKADVLITNGAGMESFVDKVAARFPRLKIVPLAEGIPLIKGRGEEGDNPHVWVSISNAIVEVRNLGKAMEQLDPPHAGIYRANTDAYAAKLDALRTRMKAELAPFAGSKIITLHEAFPYFAQEFGLEIAAVVQREPGSEPSAKELAETIDLVRKARIKALFGEPQYSSGAADAIARETGAKVYVLDPAVTGPDDPDAYVRIMDKNLDVLSKALKGTAEEN